LLFLRDSDSLCCMLRCPNCGHVIPEKTMREEMARLMIKRRPRTKLDPKKAREMGKLGASKRWAKSSGK
jgi:uncharacterized Zn finger protein